MRRSTAIVVGTAAALLATGCRVGPNYQRPAVPTPPAFKEEPPASYGPQSGWKNAAPGDAQLKGDWWTMFNDPQLNELESRIDSANFTLQQATANYQAAVAQVAMYRSNQAPTVGVAPVIGTTRNSTNQPYYNTNVTNRNAWGDFSLPFQINYEVDLWGRIRRSIESAGDRAQATAADRENIRLSLHAELAVDYFNLRAADGQQRLLQDTVQAFQRALQLTTDRYEGGASPLSDVTQARTQLQAAQVQQTEVDIQRQNYEHAIAVLTARAPAELTIVRTPVTVNPPALPQIPAMLPSALLERRPDIAEAERMMAAQNEQIGIAKAAYYPTFSINTTVGFLSRAADTWFDWPSRFFSVGPTLSQTLYDHGRRASLTNAARAQYDASVAGYRQTTLTAFQQVEDNLNALRQLEVESDQQRDATSSAQQSLDLFNTRYEGGVDNYLQVITWQTSLLSNQRNDIEIERRRLEATVLLIKALGGGWNAATLPRP